MQVLKLIKLEIAKFHSYEVGCVSRTEILNQDLKIYCNKKVFPQFVRYEIVILIRIYFLFQSLPLPYNSHFPRILAREIPTLKS